MTAIVTIRTGDRPVEVLSDFRQRPTIIKPRSEAIFELHSPVPLILGEVRPPAEAGAAADARDDEALKQTD